MSEPFLPSLGWHRDLPDPRDFGPDHPTVRKMLRRLKRRRKKRGELPSKVDLGEFFPPASDLPEGIADKELELTYGGVGGALYRRFADEIERRIASCLAYQ